MILKVNPGLKTIKAPVMKDCTEGEPRKREFSLCRTAKMLYFPKISCMTRIFFISMLVSKGNVKTQLLCSSANKRFFQSNSKEVISGHLTT